MRRIEDIVKALEFCADENMAACEECPYVGNCKRMRIDASEAIKEMNARLINLSQPTAMPNYEVEYNRLHCENTQLHIELTEMREELIFLRAVKAAVEAVLGREIK